MVIQLKRRQQLESENWKMNFYMTCLLWSLFTSAIALTLHLIAREKKHSRSQKLPPGPRPLPIIGNLLDLGDKPHKSLTRLAKIHGPLMSLKLGQVTTVVISSAPLAQEVLQKHDITFCNRFVPDAVRAHRHNEFGLVFTPVSTPWTQLRKICKNHIFSIQKLEANQDLRLNKVQDVLAYVQERCLAGEAVDIGQAAFTTTINALSNTIFSLDLTDLSSGAAGELKKVVRKTLDEAGRPNFADFFPILKMIDPQGRRRRSEVFYTRLFHLFDVILDKRLQLRKEQGYVPTNDMLDTLLSIGQDSSEDISMEPIHIKHLFLDLFVAGNDTTSSTMEWAMTELLRNPNILSKARAEIEQTIGKDNVFKESDAVQLPYLQAIIKETLRLHPSAPFLLPRIAGADVDLSGFTVPKGSQVLVNAWAIGRDPSLWEDPDSFLPERFLGSDVDVKGKNFELIPFGAGRRICPGLPLAIRLLPLMLGSLIHSFDWKLEDGVTPQNMDMEDRFGLTLQKAQPLRAVPFKI